MRPQLKMTLIMYFTKVLSTLLKYCFFETHKREEGESTWQWHLKIVNVKKIHIKKIKCNGSFHSFFQIIYFSKHISFFQEKNKFV